MYFLAGGLSAPSDFLGAHIFLSWLYPQQIPPTSLSAKIFYFKNQGPKGGLVGQKSQLFTIFAVF